MEDTKRVVVALGAALDERIVGHRERQPRDDYAAQEIAGQVDTLPERLGAEQHGLSGHEALEQRAARAVDPLREHGDTGLVEPAESAGDVAHRGVRSEERERPTAQRSRDVLDRARDVLRVAILAWDGDVARDNEKGMAPVIERRADLLRSL